MRTWRITAAQHDSLDGEGARRYGSRWTPKGVAVVYVSATLSLAVLERFVHTDPDLEPLNLVAVPVDADAGLTIESLDAADLPADWRTYPAPESLARLGANWVSAARTALLAVPSAVIPHERNYLLNPGHPEFGRLVIGPAEPFAFDPTYRVSSTASAFAGMPTPCS